MAPLLIAAALPRRNHVRGFDCVARQRTPFGRRELAQRHRQPRVAEPPPERESVMTDGFGARLRRERERRNISLDAIASATKIKKTLFEALERDDASKWPSGIFRRSFIRAYAKAVGLDPEVVVRDFAASFPDPSEPREVQSATVRPLSRTELRLRLDDSGSSSTSPTRRRIVDGPLRRCAVVMCDAALLACDRDRSARRVGALLDAGRRRDGCVLLGKPGAPRAHAGRPHRRRNPSAAQPHGIDRGASKRPDARTRGRARPTLFRHHHNGRLKCSLA